MSEPRRPQRGKSLAQASALLTREWDYGRNELTPAEVSRASHERVWWLGSQCGHSWRASVNNRYHARTGCPLCAKRQVQVGSNDLATTHPELALEWDESNEEEPSSFSAMSKHEAHWRCSRCSHRWRASLQNRAGGKKTGCPRCAQTYSKLELLLLDFLRAKGHEPLVNTRPLRFQGKVLEIDLLLPELKLGFEVQDFSTHSRDRDDEPLTAHFRQYALLRKAPPHKKGPAYHELKRRLAHEQLGITLVDIWEDELLSDSHKAKVSELLSLQQERFLA